MLAWLDEGRDSGGQAYLQMRRRLVLYFQRKRCLTPEDLADETLNRVTRRLEEEGSITDSPPGLPERLDGVPPGLPERLGGVPPGLPERLGGVPPGLPERLGGVPPARYCYIVARFVLLEHLRDPEVRHRRDVDVSEPRNVAEVYREGDAERWLECLDRCLSALARDDRTLILDYYRHEQRARIERRRHLAASLRLTLNALAIRACRIRDKLERCVSACRAGGESDRFPAFRSQ